VPQLSSIHISRFRGIREGEVTELSDVNILTGQNNSGKSTVAEAITRVVCHACANNLDPFGRERMEAWVGPRNEPGAPVVPELWYRSDTSELLRISLRAGRKELSVEGTLSEERLHMGGARSTDPDLLRFASRVTQFNPPDSNDSRFERAVWRPILSNRSDKKLATAVAEVYGLTGVEGITLPIDGRLTMLFQDYSLPLDVQGEGTRAALRCLMLLAGLEDTMLIMEHPEGHQHPGALSRFATVLCKLAHQQSVQLLLTTHSRDCVRAFFAAASAAGSKAALFHLTLKDGDLQTRRLEEENFMALEGIGTDVRFLDLYE